MDSLNSADGGLASHLCRFLHTGLARRDWPCKDSWSSYMKEHRMRRLTLALVALSLPAASLAAQRGMKIPTLGRTPDRPAEKPPQAPGIHDVRLYNRYKLSRFSLESSPMLSYMQTTGFVAEGVPTDYWTFGDATQLSYRMSPSVFLTSAFTSSSIGGPFQLGTAEFGTRIKPMPGPRFSPFVEARYSWAYTSGTAMPSSAVPVVFVMEGRGDNFSTGHGRGALFGFGVDTRITARYSVTTALSRTHYEMHGQDISRMASWNYVNDATRLLVGLRYNHGHWYGAP